MVSFPEAYQPGYHRHQNQTSANSIWCSAKGHAVRYPVGVGKHGKQWAGLAHRRQGPQSRLVSVAEVKRDKPSMPDVIPGGSPANLMGVRGDDALRRWSVCSSTAPQSSMRSSIGGFVSGDGVTAWPMRTSSTCTTGSRWARRWPRTALNTPYLELIRLF